MNPTPSRDWLGAALLFGVAYFAVGKLFALPSDNLKFWRILAWLTCFIAYGAHILWERYRRGSAPASGAGHVAAGVAIGAALLAIAAMIYNHRLGRSIDSFWLLALVAWPVLTAIPSFLGAWVAGIALARLARANIHASRTRQ